MAILFFDDCQALAQHDTNCFPGDETWTAVGTPEFSASGAYQLTNGMFFNASGDEFECPAAGNINKAVGSALIVFKVSAWVDATIIWRAKGTSVNDLLQLELGVTDELIFRHRVNGVLNSPMTTDSANLTTGVFYIAIMDWDATLNDRRLRVYDTGLTELDAVEDLATAISEQTDLITIEALTSSTPDVSVALIIISDTYGELTAANGNFTSYTDFAPGDPPPTITDVDTDEIVTANQANVVITGTDFDTATVAVRDGSLSVAASIDSQNATTITADLGGVGTTTGIRYGSRVLRVTNGDAQFDDQAITLNPPSGVAYFQLSGTLAAGTDVDAYAESQTYASGVGLTLEAAAADIDPPRRLIFTANSNESATNFTIVGEDENGAPAIEVVAGPNNGVTVSSGFFSVVTSVTPNATEGTDDIQVGADTLRLEASPDIANTHQIEISAIVGAGMTIADVTINADGTYSWTLGVEGFTWRSHNVTEGWGATADIVILVDQPPVLTTASLPDATLGVFYSTTLEATGEGPFSFSAIGLPSWASLDEESGLLSGTPDAITPTTPEFTVSNLHGDSDPVELDLDVVYPEPEITTTTLPNGFIDSSYSQQIVHTGNPSASFALTVGSLPDGLSMSVGGLITGTPTTEETQGFTVEVTTAEGTDTQALSIEILAVQPIWVSYSRVWRFKEVRRVYLTTTRFKAAVEADLRGAQSWTRWAPGTLPWSGSSNMQINVSTIPGVPPLRSNGQPA